MRKPTFLRVAKTLIILYLLVTYWMAALKGIHDLPYIITYSMGLVLSSILALLTLLWIWVKFPKKKKPLNKGDVWGVHSAMHSERMKEMLFGFQKTLEILTARIQLAKIQERIKIETEAGHDHFRMFRVKFLEAELAKATEEITTLKAALAKKKP